MAVAPGRGKLRGMLAQPGAPLRAQLEGFEEQVVIAGALEFLKRQQGDRHGR
jgi:hypothetical protein